MTTVKGIEWLSERIPYPESAVTGDTFPMTWADDDAIYASAGDPMWGGSHQDNGMDVEKFVGGPTSYRILRPNMLPDFLGFGGDGPKPSGMISVNGTLYLACQNLKGKRPSRDGSASQHGSDTHILVSRDHGSTWTPRFTEIREPMFLGHRFGGPAFVNFGKDNAGARDEYVYAVSTDQWDNGTELRLGRAPKDRILERAAWQWVGSTGGTEPSWTADLEQSMPVLRREHSIGLPEMVYLAAIKRYLLLTWRLHQPFSPSAGSDLLIYEAPQPWGPFELVYQEEDWETRVVNAYCPRLPLKWLEPDGITGWLQFSGSWTSTHDRDGFRPYYRSNVRRFKLLLK